MPVALGQPLGRALVRGGADHAGELGLDQGLVDGLGGLADAVIDLRGLECVQDLQQCRLVKGHRALCPFARTIAVVSLTIARWPLQHSSHPVGVLLPTPLGGKTKREARAFLAQVEGDKSRGLYVDPAGAQLRFRELADRWWAAREVELTTAAANRSRLDNHVLPMWGEWPIGALSTWTCRRGWTRLSHRLAPETVASCHGLLSAILATAVRSRKLGGNPCDGVRLPPRRRTADAGDDQPASSSWARSCPCSPAATVPWWPQRPAPVCVGVIVGLRRRRDVLRRELRVVEVAVGVAGRVSFKHYPKSKASRRTVPLPDFLDRGLGRAPGRVPG